jgi:uncharacterized lipoprotein YbaY
MGKESVKISGTVSCKGICLEIPNGAIANVSLIDTSKKDYHIKLHERQISNIKSFPFPFEIEYEYSAFDKAITAEYVIAVQIKYGENLIYSTSSQIININQNSNKLLKNIGIYVNSVNFKNEKVSFRNLF